MIDLYIADNLACEILCMFQFVIVTFWHCSRISANIVMMAAKAYENQHDLRSKCNWCMPRLS